MIGLKPEEIDRLTITRIGKKLTLSQEMADGAIGVRRRDLLVVLPLGIARLFSMAQARKRVESRAIESRCSVNGENRDQEELSNPDRHSPAFFLIYRSLGAD